MVEFPVLKSTITHTPTRQTGTPRTPVVERALMIASPCPSSRTKKTKWYQAAPGPGRRTKHRWHRPKPTTPCHQGNHPSSFRCPLPPCRHLSLWFTLAVEVLTAAPQFEQWPPAVNIGEQQLARVRPLFASNPATGAGAGPPNGPNNLLMTAVEQLLLCWLALPSNLVLK